MTLEAVENDRLDLTVKQGAINVITIRLWRKNSAGARVVWDESVAPTVLAEIRPSFASDADVDATFSVGVETPTIDGVDTLTLTLTLDLTPGEQDLDVPADAGDDEPIVNVGWWDFRLTTDGGEVYYPLYGQMNMRRWISRA